MFDFSFSHFLNVLLLDPGGGEGLRDFMVGPVGVYVKVKGNVLQGVSFMVGAADFPRPVLGCLVKSLDHGALSWESMCY